jgi:hypothetical protein
MPRVKPATVLQVTARTIRFPAHLRARLGDDAQRCGRSFEAQVLAILRRHYGEDVDIAPSPDAILSLAVGSLAGIPDPDLPTVTRRLVGEPR